MIQYLRCTEVSMDSIYQAFTRGFSDYIIKMEIPLDMFVARFFGPEGNALEHSFLAIEGDRPVGVILGGIKEYEGIKTMRCGTLCLDPDYRGKGISQRLLELHRSEAIKQGCKQLFLEVIVGNDRAIAFYKKSGYDKVYDLSYFSLKDTQGLKDATNNHDVREIAIKDLREIMENSDAHINWQNDVDYIESSQGFLHLGVVKEGKVIGAISLNKSSKLSFLWVDKAQRGRGIAKALLAAATEKLELTKISASFPNSDSLEGFVKKMGFERDKIAQYEMYGML